MSTTAYASDYTVAALTAAERTGNRPDECSCCDRAGLKHIVKLRHADGGIAWMGTSCAARALYGHRTSLTAAVRNRISNDAIIAAQRADQLDERRTRFARMAADFDARNETAELLQARRTYRTLGGHDVIGSFSAWLARVAETGLFDDETS